MAKKVTKPKQTKGKVSKPIEQSPFDKELAKFSTEPAARQGFPNMVSIMTAPGWAKGYVGKKYIAQAFADKAIRELIESKLGGTLKKKKDLIKQAETLIENGGKSASKQITETIGDVTWSIDSGFGLHIVKNNDWDYEQ